MSNELRKKQEVSKLTHEYDPHVPEIETRFLIKNPIVARNKVRYKTLEFIIIHSPGVAQSNPYHIYKRWNSSNAVAAVHFILNDEVIYRLLPENCVCWGTGRGVNGSVNGKSIQIECCEPDGHSYDADHEIVGYDLQKNEIYFKKMWSNLVDLCYTLCIAYGLKSDKIFGHADMARMGFASKHKDPEHWFKLHGKTIKDLRCDVEKLISNMP